MKASELREKLDEEINEFGDGEVYLRDQLQPEYRIKIEDVEFESDREAYVLASADD